MKVVKYITISILNFKYRFLILIIKFKTIDKLHIKNVQNPLQRQYYRGQTVLSFYHHLLKILGKEDTG